MPRIFIISIVILSALVWFAVKARQSNHKTLAAALFTAAGMYSLILIAGFFGFIGA